MSRRILTFALGLVGLALDALRVPRVVREWPAEELDPRRWN